MGGTGRGSSVSQGYLVRPVSENIAKHTALLYITIGRS